MIRPVPFDEQTVIIAEHQDEYISLPAHIGDTPEKTVTFCLKLDWKDRLVLLFTGKLWHQVMTFGTSLQPQLVTTYKPKELLCYNKKL